MTRYLSWPTHRSLKETQTFLQFAEEGWESGRSLTYLIEASGGLLLGSTGLDGETHYRYSTGYVLARDAWGRGFATEALIAILDLAFSRPEVRRVYALCDVSHVASARVMEKSGMEREAILRRHTLLPNLSAEPRDMLCYAMAR